MAGNLREKTFEKCNFCGENFHRLLAFAMPKDATPPNFTFANSHKTAKLAKVFSLESFPLYGIIQDDQKLEMPERIKAAYSQISS